MMMIFFLAGSPPIQKNHQIKFWVPLVLGHKKSLSRSLRSFRVGCAHSTDSELCGHAKYANQFHHTILQCWTKIGASTFSRSKKIASCTIICGLGNPSLECEYLLRTQKPTQKLKHCIVFAHVQSKALCKARKLFSSKKNAKKRSPKSKPGCKLDRMNQVGGKLNSTFFT